MLNRPSRDVYSRYIEQRKKDKVTKLNLAKLVFHPHYDYQYKSTLRQSLNEYSSRIQQQAREYCYMLKTQYSKNKINKITSKSPYRRFYAGKLGVLLNKYGFKVNQAIIDLNLSYNYFVNYILNLEEKCNQSCAVGDNKIYHRRTENAITAKMIYSGLVNSYWT